MLQRAMPYFVANLLALGFVQCGGSSSNSPSAASPPPPPAEAPADMSANSGTSSAAVANNGNANTNSMTGSTPGTNESSTAANSGSSTSSNQATAGQSLSDAEIAGITDAANSGEMEQARLARTKSKNQKVQQYASMMITQHGDAQKKQSKLNIKTDESAISRRMIENGNQILTDLKAKTGNDFDRAYMDAQVDQHRQVLDTIDNQLLPSAKSSDLRALLEQIRPTIEHHLQMAQQLQQSLNAPSQNPSSANQKATGTQSSNENRNSNGAPKTSMK